MVNIRISLVTGKDVSPIVEQKCGMTFLKKLSRHRPCIALKKMFSLFSLFPLIFIAFCNSFIAIFLY